MTELKTDQGEVHLLDDGADSVNEVSRSGEGVAGMLVVNACSTGKYSTGRHSTGKYSTEESTRSSDVFVEKL